MIIAAQVCNPIPSWTHGLIIGTCSAIGIILNHANKEIKAAKDEVHHYRIELDRAHTLMNVLKARKDR